MGVLDDLSNTFTKGTAVVERNARILVLKTRIGEVQSRRSSAVSALGADMYQQYRNNPEVRAGREQLFDNVTNCDNEIADLQAQIQRLEAEAAAAASEIPVNQAYQQRSAQQTTCPSCGSSLPAGARFCHACGAQIPIPAPAATPAPEAQTDPTPEPVAAPECAREPEVVEAVAGVYEVPSDTLEDKFYVESKPQTPVAAPASAPAPVDAPAEPAQPVHPAEVQPHNVSRD